ncbi:Swarming motility protein YbiA [compost metagenome]
MIKFYSRSTEYFELSNFGYSPFVLWDKQWPTVEHAFQAAKFYENPEHQSIIQAAKTPADAKRLGLSRKYPIYADWDQRRIEVMRECLFAKFTQNAQLKELLLSTGDEELVEDSPSDSFWGRGPGWKGRNMLGKLLVELRTKLQSEN